MKINGTCHSNFSHENMRMRPSFFSASHVRMWSMSVAIAAAATAALAAPTNVAWAGETQPDVQASIIQHVDQSTDQTTSDLIQEAAGAASNTGDATDAEGTTAQSDVTGDTQSENQGLPQENGSASQGISEDGAGESAGTSQDNAGANGTGANGAGISNSSESGNGASSAAGASDQHENNPGIGNSTSSTGSATSNAGTDLPSSTSNGSASAGSSTGNARDAQASPEAEGIHIEPASEHSVTIQGSSETFTSLEQAIAQAHDGDTIVVSGTFDDVASLTIDKNITIVAADTGAKITFHNQHGMLVTNGASLTLGDTSTNQIAFIAKNHDASISNSGTAYIVQVQNGKLILHNSAYLELSLDSSANNVVFQGSTIDLNGAQASADIDGGTVKALNENSTSINTNIALYVRDGAHIGTISGGDFTSYQQSLDVYNGSSIGQITGGTFRSLVNYKSGGDRVNAYVENNSSIGTISGGMFISSPSDDSKITADTTMGALTLLYGSHIDTISGGTFYTPGSYTYYDPGSRYGVLVFQTSDGSYTSSAINKITGGLFSAPIGLFLTNNTTGTNDVPTIGEISGGSFIAGSAENPVFDRGSGYGVFVMNSKIGKITGGQFAGPMQTNGYSSYGLYNGRTGNVGNITGGDFLGLYSGIRNAGTMGHLISGSFTGLLNGLIQEGHCAGIGGGIYTGTYGSAIALYQPTNIETHLEGQKGRALFKGAPSENGDPQGAFNDLSKAIFPHKYHVSHKTTDASSSASPAGIFGIFGEGFGPDNGDDGGYHYLIFDTTISYDPNGGTGNPISDTQEGDTNFTVINNPYTNAHHVFTGWNTEPDGSGETIDPGDVVSLDYFDDDLMLYAQWMAGEDPDIPDVPDQPDDPDDPDEPDDNPEEPDTPEEPESPEVPGTPDIPHGHFPEGPEAPQVVPATYHVDHLAEAVNAPVTHEAQASVQKAENTIPQTSDHVSGNSVAALLAGAAASLVTLLSALGFKRRKHN